MGVRRFIGIAAATAAGAVIASALVYKGADEKLAKVAGEIKSEIKTSTDEVKRNIKKKRRKKVSSPVQEL